MENFVIFDFDHTLIDQSSLKSLLINLHGKPRVILTAIKSGLMALRHSNRPRREIFREKLLQTLLSGRTLQEVERAANQMAPALKWNRAMVDRLHWHRDQGHRILIATGGLAAYMPILLKSGDIAYDGLLASEMVMEGDSFTGEMAGPACTWEEKARRVKNWVAAQGLSFETGESWGYGNPPNDNAMLALTRHPTEITP